MSPQGVTLPTHQASEALTMRRRPSISHGVVDEETLRVEVVVVGVAVQVTELAVQWLP